MSFSGPMIQNAIYIAQQPPEWPVAFADWERAAEQKLDEGAFGYIVGGAGAEETMRANLDAFRRRVLRPRMLVGTPERDLSVEVLGLRSPVPFLLAPVGVLSIVHPDAERAVARASKATGVPFVVSSAASTSLEDVAAIEPPRWFQLYWWGDPELAESLVRRVEAAGYGAIVLTVDTLNLGWRPRDLGNGYFPFLAGHGLEQFFSDPVFAERLEKTPTEDRATASLMALAAFSNLALTWDDLGRLREWTSLPVLLKGILRGDDATRALDLGIDGIVVSNHGGRQVDGSIAALDALVEVRDAVGPDPVVLMDSGVRTAADVLKAVALGADAVLLGRPYVYGLAVAGQEGVETVIKQLAGEIDLTMALAGARNVAELDRSFVV